MARCSVVNYPRRAPQKDCRDSIDEVITIGNDEAFAMAREAAILDGIPCGISSREALIRALQGRRASRNEGQNRGHRAVNDLLPLILLFLFGGFAVLSAVLKSRARVTAPLGVALAVLEGISGMVLMGAAVPMSGSLETASRVGIATALVVGISSTVHLVKVRERSRAREASEGKRLYGAIKYGIGDNPSVTGDEPSEPDASTGLEDDPPGNSHT